MLLMRADYKRNQALEQFVSYLAANKAVRRNVSRPELGGGGQGKFRARQEKTELKDTVLQIAIHQEVYA